MYDYDLWAKTMLGVRAFDECGNRIKEDNKMDFQFNIGDVVTTQKDEFGYICEIIDENNFKVKWEKNNKDILTIFRHDQKFKPTNKYFKRIGKYTFQSETKPEKIEKLSLRKTKNECYYGKDECVAFESMGMPDEEEMMDKINEIIDYINKQGE